MEKEKLYLASTGKEVAIGEKICGHLVKDDTTSIIVIAFVKYTNTDISFL